MKLDLAKLEKKTIKHLFDINGVKFTLHIQQIDRRAQREATDKTSKYEVHGGKSVAVMSDETLKILKDLQHSAVVGWEEVYFNGKNQKFNEEKRDLLLDKVGEWEIKETKKVKKQACDICKKEDIEYEVDEPMTIMDKIQQIANNIELFVKDDTENLVST